MKLVFATHNKNKLLEIQALMPPHIELLSLDDIGCTEEIMEDAPTIEGNAKLKATYVKQTYGYDCFADDTGLEVEALNGAPGVYSARYASERRDANENMDKLLYRLDPFDNRRAQFKTAITYITDTHTELFIGLCKGQISHEKMGSQGFGYDPIFKPDGHKQTFAQMPMALKGKISHRGIAFAKLMEFLTNNG
ncbi:MAG: non-canonical purine NTP diphosphatase [Gilvibacter sp.]